MSKVKIQGNASGTGVLTVTAPNTSTDRTITLPDATGTLLNSDGDGSNLTGISSVGGATGVDFNDSVKARFGTGNDLEIYHDGTHSYIKDVGTGDLRIKGTELSLRSDSADEPYINCAENGSVDLFYNNTKTFETINGGAKVNGTLLVGATASPNSSNSGVQLVNNSDGNDACRSSSGSVTSFRHHFIFYNGNGQVGSISTNGSATAFNTSSDYRLKENVDYTWDATTRLKQLKPARFNFIADDTNTLVDGFIAHEVSSVVPEAVSGEKDALEEDGSIKPQVIDQAKLVPLLVKTIQELEARIETLENA